MKTLTFAPALLAGALTLTSCGSGASSLGNGSLLGSLAGAATGQTVGTGLTGNQNTTSNNSSNKQTSTGSVIDSEGGLLGSLLSGLLGTSQTLTKSDLTGKWLYTGTDCAFQSENLLLKAGGEVAATKIEANMNEQLAKVGIKEGACSFTFNDDDTYVATIGTHKIEGQYTINATDKTVTMTFLGGIATMTPHVVMQGGNISLLYESDKLLSLLKATTALSSNTSFKTVSSLLQKYDGLYVGIKLAK